MWRWAFTCLSSKNHNREKHHVRNEDYHSSGNERRLQSRENLTLRPSGMSIAPAAWSMPCCTATRMTRFRAGAGLRHGAGRWLIGQVIYMRSEIDCDDGRKVPIATFGPHRHCARIQAAGLGKSCSTIPWKKLREMGAGARITGNIDFYGKSVCACQNKGASAMPMTRGGLLLIRELTPAFWTASPALSRPGGLSAEKNPKAFEQFESRLPKKEKRGAAGGQLC